MACFTLNDALVKLLSATLPIGQIMALRGLLVVVGMVVVLRVLKLRIALPERWTMVRATLEVGVTFCFLTALSRIPLAEATTIFFAAPVIATGLAALVLGERVGPRRWSAVIAGFIGVFIAAGPRGSADPAVLLAFLAAVLSALRDLATRRVPPETGSGTVALVTAGCVTLGGLATAGLGWQPVPRGTLPLLVVAAVLVAGGYVLFVSAIRMADLSFVASFRYTAIPLAMLLGAVVWNDRPTAPMVLGALIIAAAGLFIVYRERQLRQAGSR